MDPGQFATQIRRATLEMVHRVDASHVGGGLSMADMLAVLYTETLKVRPEQPGWPERDRFILSKGHTCAALYAALALRGFFPVEELQTYGRDGSRLMTHISHKVPGVEFSTGSLGHALPFGAGKALAAKRLGKAWRVFVMLSDGELDEGSNWEAILFAPQHQLDNLTVLVDYNKIQSLGGVSEILELEPLAEKFRAFRWAVRGNRRARSPSRAGGFGEPAVRSRQASCLIAHTVKGKGVSYMENELRWHYKSPNAEQLKQALGELGPS